jgi:hypothetical protein
MTRSPVYVIVASLLLAVAPVEPGSGMPPPAAAQDPRLAAGIRQVDEGDFEGAVLTLEPLAASLAATGGHDAAAACLYLGIAQLALDQRDAARARFLEALSHEPSLRVGPERFSPKVIAAFDEARREHEALARAAAPGEPAKPEGKGGHGGRTALIVGGAGAAALGIALAAGGGNEPPPPGAEPTFTGARFGTPVLECPNGTSGTPLPVAIDLQAQNGGSSDVTISAVSAVLIIVASPVVPGEVGFASSAAATVSPTTLRPGTTALRVQTTLTCANGEGDASRFNEWKGRVTLTTSGAQSVETVDTMRVNLP